MAVGSLFSLQPQLPKTARFMNSFIQPSLVGYLQSDALDLVGAGLLT